MIFTLYLTQSTQRYAEKPEANYLKLTPKHSETLSSFPSAFGVASL
jgi:hypothetical protein